LLGLPCGVCGGLMKRECEGVVGSYSFVDRVRSGGGGIGSLRSLFSCGLLAIVSAGAALELQLGNKFNPCQ
jgi:hypothetical protein